jgi:hypothetical protein
MAELCAKMIKKPMMPNSTKNGINHHFFSCLRNITISRNSDNINSLLVARTGAAHGKTEVAYSRALRKSPAIKVTARALGCGSFQSTLASLNFKFSMWDLATNDLMPRASRLFLIAAS